MTTPLPSPLEPWRGVVRALPFLGDDAALVEGLRAGNPNACAALVDRFSDHVLRVLVRILGRHPDVEDLHHDVFVRALSAAHDVRDPSALKGWVTIIAVNLARTAIARRTRSRWLWFLPPEELPEPSETFDDDAAEALSGLYRVLDKLPTEERIAFTLRFVDGMELTQVAEACGVSLATIKRRLSKAEDRFVKSAGREPTLRHWLEDSRFSAVRTSGEETR